MKQDNMPAYLLDLKRKLKKQFPQLTNEDLLTRQDNENVMLSTVAYKLRKTKAQLVEIIKGL